MCYKIKEILSKKSVQNTNTHCITQRRTKYQANGCGPRWREPKFAHWFPRHNAKYKIQHKYKYKYRIHDTLANISQISGKWMWAKMALALG